VRKRRSINPGYDIRMQEEARESREKSHKLQASLISAENNIKVKAIGYITRPVFLKLNDRG